MPSASSETNEKASALDNVNDAEYLRHFGNKRSRSDDSEGGNRSNKYPD